MLRGKSGFVPQPGYIRCQPVGIICRAGDSPQPDQVRVMHLVCDLFNQLPDRDGGAACYIDRTGDIGFQQKRQRARQIINMQEIPFLSSIGAIYGLTYLQI